MNVLQVAILCPTREPLGLPEPSIHPSNNHIFGGSKRVAKYMFCFPTSDRGFPSRRLPTQHTPQECPGVLVPTLPTKAHCAPLNYLSSTFVTLSPFVFGNLSFLLHPLPPHRAFFVQTSVGDAERHRHVEGVSVGNLHVPSGPYDRGRTRPGGKLEGLNNRTAGGWAV